MIQKLKALYQESEFNPTFMGLISNPFYITRKALQQSIVKHHSFLSGRVLDIGCGTKPYRDLFKVTEYVGLDIDTQTSREYGAADVYYPGGKFPFGSSSFDSAFSSQVLEHVFEPIDFLTEIHRVLKPGGHLLLTVPFCWEEHEAPFDYGRYSSFGLKYLLEKHGFQVVHQEKNVAGLAAICQLFLGYFFSTGINKNKYINLVIKLLLCPIPNCIAIAFDSPQKNSLYLDNVVLAVKT